MLKDVVWASDGTYRPGEKFSPEKFFNDGLKNSCSFDLQLGISVLPPSVCWQKALLRLFQKGAICALSSIKLFQRRIRRR